MHKYLEQDFENQTPTVSLGKSLAIAGVISLLVIIGFVFWVDRSNRALASEAYASAQDLIGQENYDQALVKLDEAIQYKDNAQYLYTKSKVLNAEGRYNEAGLDLEKAFEKDNKNAAYAFEVACFYLGRGGSWKKGIEYLERAVALDPKNSDYKLMYGSTLAQYGKLAQSIQVLEQLAQDDPNYYSVWNDLATDYGYDHHPEKELKIRLLAVKKFPKDAYHWYWLANTYDRQGQQELAVQAYRKSVALAPETGANAAYRIAKLTGSKVPEKYREIVEDSIPVVFRDTHAFIRAKIAGYQGLFLLDTGASDTILYQRFIDKHAFDIGTDNPTVQYETAGGMISAPIVYADARIGRFPLDNIRVAVIPSLQSEKDVDGIIGMNVLKNFDMKMDNLHGTLIFSQK